jgi:hypothetical protein
MIWRIVMAWLVTVPVTIAIAAGLVYDPLQVRTRLPAGAKEIRTEQSLIAVGECAYRSARIRLQALQPEGGRIGVLKSVSAEIFKWDQRFESAFLQRRVRKLLVPACSGRAPVLIFPCAPLLATEGRWGRRYLADPR